MRASGGGIGLRIVGALLVAACIAACAGIQADYAATPSHAFDQPRATALGRAFAANEALNPGESGFRLLNNGVSALMTRAALADLAEQAIDIQYYHYDGDAVGIFLLQRLLAAADRGVRVRMLLDDHELGLDDTLLAQIDAHPNIEVRIFNPFPDRSRWSRGLQLLLQIDRLGRRMHNKVFAVDGEAAVLGGRNISNRYFEGQTEANFRDIDLLAVGPVVHDVGRLYDAFWNSELAVPVAAIGPAAPGGADARGLAKLRAQSAGGPAAEYARSGATAAQRLLAGGDDLIWSVGRAIGEPPIRQAPGADKPSAAVARALALAREQAQREIVYETAYFVPGTRGVEVLSATVQRGVSVRILTNSLAATDVVPVHAGYARYRESLLAAGIELYEYRPVAARPGPSAHRIREGYSGSALHAKVVVFDRRVVWVGSANFDPRSRRLNTEAGLLIDSAPLAERLLVGMHRDFGPANSWRLTLEAAPDGGAKRIVWNGERDGQPVSLTREPDAGLGRRLGAGFYSLLPGIEELL